MPRVSIIMPIYNGEEYITDAIESILSQTFSDFEFIIINEFGSNDKVSALLAEFVAKDARIRVMQNQSRLGISASLNVGLSCASGEYIARMDGDDISLPQRLELQVAYMDAHPEVGMCGTRVIEFGSKAIDWKIETDSNQIASDLLFYTPCVPPTIMIRKAVLDGFKLQYNPGNRSAEDNGFFVRLGAVTRIANIDSRLYKYRVMEYNTTFRNNEVGVFLCENVMKSQFLSLSIDFSDEEIRVLSPSFGMRRTCGLDCVRRLIDLDLLLKRILFNTNIKNSLNIDNLFLTLKRRFTEAYYSMSWACTDYDQRKANTIFERSIFTKPCFYHDKRIDKVVTPIITVLMPTFNSERYVADAVWSILEQTFQDFELLVVNEFGSNDATVSIIRSFIDNRINVIQNKTRLGLADSLNLGIMKARGKYIARIDADDLAHPDRLKLEFDFLEANPEYGVCGSWQHHFGIQTDSFHKPPTSHDELKARFIFWCDLCHSTLMLRTSSFIDHKLFYDKTFAAEDFELWTRAIHYFKFANLPIVLGEYRVGDDNITAGKLSALSYESGIIAARTLENHLKVKVPQSHIKYFGNWNNEFDRISKINEFISQLRIERQVLECIWINNEKLGVYSESALLNAINQRWKWIIHTWIFGEEIVTNLPIEHLFDSGCEFRKLIRKKRLAIFVKRIAAVDKSGKVYKYMKQVQGFLKKKRNVSVKEFLKKLKSRLLPASSRSFHAFAWSIQNKIDLLSQNQKVLLEGQRDQFVSENNSKALADSINAVSSSLENLNHNVDTISTKVVALDRNQYMVEETLRKQYQLSRRINQKLVENSFRHYKVNYIIGEKIRIVFFFQIASFWPSWDSFYNLCESDSRIETKFVLLSDIVNETAQTKTARTFLTEHNISFINDDELDLSVYKPHIVVFQTPYDHHHRYYTHWAESIKASGTRIVYIPYGVEIGDTMKARDENYNNEVIENAWRCFTISPQMLRQYQKYSINANAVRAVGHPKFDALDNRKFPLSAEVLRKVGNRKICLWKVHFTNRFVQEGRIVQITPELNIYISFAEQLPMFKEWFFIFMPHPKFREGGSWIENGVEQVNALFEKITRSDNVFVYTADDYRPGLTNADCIITDRSSIMIEAGAMNVPVLYMYNEFYKEPMSEAILPLVESYYQGSSSKEMSDFIDMCQRKEDPKKNERGNAFQTCVPFADGGCGRRILDCIVNDLLNE